KGIDFPFSSALRVRSAYRSAGLRPPLGKKPRYYSRVFAQLPWFIVYHVFVISARLMLSQRCDIMRRMMKLAHGWSDRRSPKPSRNPVLCVGKSGGTVGVALCAVAPAIGFLNATGASTPTLTPVFTLNCRERAQSRLAKRLSYPARAPSSRP